LHLNHDEQTDLFAAPRTGTKTEKLRQVAEEAAACTKCHHSKTRNVSVFSGGSPEAKIMLIAEAPGRRENKTGKPFTGKAGDKLDEVLAAVKLRRTDIYICNVIKCWPLDNGEPGTKAMLACRPFLMEQIDIMKPKVIVAMGNWCLKDLFGSSMRGIVRETGTLHHFKGIPVIPCIHTAAILRPRDPSEIRAWKLAMWEAWKKIKEIVDET